MILYLQFFSSFCRLNSPFRCKFISCVTFLLLLRFVVYFYFFLLQTCFSFIFTFFQQSFPTFDSFSIFSPRKISSLGFSFFFSYSLFNTLYILIILFFFSFSDLHYCSISETSNTYTFLFSYSVLFIIFVTFLLLFSHLIFFFLFSILLSFSLSIIIFLLLYVLLFLFDYFFPYLAILFSSNFTNSGCFIYSQSNYCLHFISSC